MMAGIVWVLFAAYYLGVYERKWLGISEMAIPGDNGKKRPKLFIP
jgi:hypothetical protein